MAQEVWESTLQGVKSYGAYGPRDVVLIAANDRLEGVDVVCRREGKLTGEDGDRLSSQGIPAECWGEDVRLVEGRYGRETSRFNLVPLGRPEGGRGEGGGELTRSYVWERIQSVMKNTDKPGGQCCS